MQWNSLQPLKKREIGYCKDKNPHVIHMIMTCCWIMKLFDILHTWWVDIILQGIGVCGNEDADKL